MISVTKRMYPLWNKLLSVKNYGMLIMGFLFATDACGKAKDKIKKYVFA
jgi:hypothetical protein